MLAQADWRAAAFNLLEPESAPMINSPTTQRRGTDEAQAHSEGDLARMIEDQTAKLPSDAFLWAALGSMGVALFLRLTDRKDESLFIGQWAAPFLLFGVYNKLVKIAGSDRTHTQTSR